MTKYHLITYLIFIIISMILNNWINQSNRLYYFVTSVGVSIFTLSTLLLKIGDRIVVGMILSHKNNINFSEYCNFRTWSVIAISGGLGGIIGYNLDNIDSRQGVTIGLGIIVSWLITKATNLDEEPVLRGMDYGSAMACNYFYGYLKIVLPRTGTKHKGILDRIEDFEDTHKVRVPTKKLFVLIPSSAYIPPNFGEISDNWMEPAVQLEEEIRDRAGVMDRSYRHSVYKIRPKFKDSPVYAVIEGATPLLTFKEAQSHTHLFSKTYKMYEKEIVRKFYHTLKYLIENDEACRDLVELVNYEDYVEGKKVNVAKNILKIIQRLEEGENRPME